MSTNDFSNRAETVTLYEEYRLIEKDESEINPAWRGVHLLFFFLAFVFGAFCTFCFHLLMYLFDEKCVLYPKLISLKDMKKSREGSISKKLLQDYISARSPEALPVDFVSTHWVDKKTCYLPTYAPLLSGICGLIWTTMFVMCSSGSPTLTGLQRPWHILPTVFVFSLAMGGFGVYTATITQSGLNELCHMLGEIVGSKTCSYTINVATLAYERRIRGVYQATRLTIMSAWLHTLCWLGSALTALIRVVLVVDFRLVKVQVDLRGNIEKMLERHETHIRTDEFLNKDDLKKFRHDSSVKVRFMNKGFVTDPQSPANFKSLATDKESEYVSEMRTFPSDLSLQPDEFRRLTIRSTSLRVPRKLRFISKTLHNIIDRIDSRETKPGLIRQKGMGHIQPIMWTPSSSSETDESTVNSSEAQEVAYKFKQHLENELSTTNFQSRTTLTRNSSNLTQIEKINGNAKKSRIFSDNLTTDESIPTVSVETLKAMRKSAEGSSKDPKDYLPTDQLQQIPLSRKMFLPDLENLMTAIMSAIENEDTFNIPTRTSTLQKYENSESQLSNIRVTVVGQQEKANEGSSNKFQHHSHLMKESLDSQKAGPAHPKDEEPREDGSNKEKLKQKEKQD